MACRANVPARAARAGVTLWILLFVSAVGSPLAAQPAPSNGQGQSASGGNESKKEQGVQRPPPSPEEKMSRRFPQPVKVSFLIGRRMLDERNSTLGRIESVARTPAGKIELVIGYGGILGLGARPVAVPIELAAMLGKDVAAVDMPSQKFKSAPTWKAAEGHPLDPDEIILVAVTRRSL